MGQDDIMKVLKKNRGWMLSGEIAVMTGVARDNTNRSLRKLYKEGVVMRKDIPTRRGAKGYLWKYKQ